MMVLPLVLSLSDDMPAIEKQKLLAPFFSPEPGRSIVLDPNDFQNRNDKEEIVLERGFIEVTAPLKSCLKINSELKTKNISVCNGKKYKIPFYLEDLDDFGRIYLEVKTSEKDFGTKLFWQSPYRRAWVVDEFDPWPGPSRAVYIEKCQIAISGDKREVQLSTLNDKTWKVKLPVKDLPSKPDYYHYYVESNGTETLLGENYQEEFKKKLEAEPTSPKKGSNQSSRMRTDRKWITDWYKTYEISGKEFYDGLPPLAMSPGKCRYAYHSHPIDRNIGVIECHGLGRFRWLLAPLSCLKPPMNPNL